MNLHMRRAVITAASAVPVAASASSYLYTSSCTTSNSLGYNESSATDQAGAFPTAGGYANRLTLGAQAYQSYYTTNSSGYRYYYQDSTSTQYNGTVTGGDARGRAVLGFAPSGYDANGGIASYGYTVNGVSGSMNPYGGSYAMAVASGMTVSLSASARDDTYSSAGGGWFNGVVGIADAPTTVVQQYTPQWTTVTSPVDPSLPLHIDGNLSLTVNRDMVNVPGVGYLHSPFRDAVVAAETIYLNGVAKAGYTWPMLNWDPGQSGNLGFGGGSGFNLDISSLAPGSSAELALSTSVVHYVYDGSGSLIGSDQIRSSYLTQTITVPEPTSIAALGVGILLLSKRRS